MWDKNLKCTGISTSLSGFMTGLYCSVYKNSFHFDLVSSSVIMPRMLNSTLSLCRVQSPSPTQAQAFAHKHSLTHTYTHTGKVSQVQIWINMLMKQLKFKFNGSKWYDKMYTFRPSAVCERWIMLLHSTALVQRCKYDTTNICFNIMPWPNWSVTLQTKGNKRWGSKTTMGTQLSVSADSLRCWVCTNKSLTTKLRCELTVLNNHCQWTNQ